ncbi:MAG: hypothetical protein ACLUFN_02590 [Eubacterium sp.]
MKIANGMEFINDETAIGKWENIGWFGGTQSNSLEKLNKKSGEYEDLFFLPNGENYWIFEGWTKGFLLIHYGGYEPVLTYKYDIHKINNKYYLFLRLNDKTEVFVKADSKQYTKATLGKHDNINMPFKNDEKIIGKWKSVGFVDKIENYSSDSKTNDLYLKSIEFFPDGQCEQEYMDDVWQDKWTKGFVLNQHRTTAASYTISEINGSEFLFIEWKMGNYIYGGFNPSYYVFIRT